MKTQIDLFGRVAVRIGSQNFSNFPTRKAAELLMLLAIHCDQPVSRRDIVGLLWPGGEGSRANNRLAATLYMLRKSLESEFGDQVAGLIGSGEGSIWLQGNFECEYQLAEKNWRSFASTNENDTKLKLAQSLISIYRGHIGSEFKGLWVEPIQSLWASRWTESIIWLSSQEHLTLDQALEKFTQLQPILPVTRSLVTHFLENSGQIELARSWQSSTYSQSRMNRHTNLEYKKYNQDELPKLARRSTMTALVVESQVVPILHSIVKEAQPTAEWVGNPQIFCARNPLIARRIASRIRQTHPLAKIYISTEVVDGENKDESRLVRWLHDMDVGETLINAAAAALIDQHDRSVVMEKSMTRAEYRLF